MIVAKAPYKLDTPLQHRTIGPSKSSIRSMLVTFCHGIASLRAEGPR